MASRSAQGSGAGYSGTPLPKKLGIKPGHRLLLANAPRGFEATLGTLPEEVQRVGPRARDADVTLLFAQRASELKRRFAPLAERMATDGGLWVAWPKQTSGMPTDLSFNVVQGVGLAAGLVDVKVCAVDDTWSGLKFSVRKRDRAARDAARAASPRPRRKA